MSHAPKLLVRVMILRIRKKKAGNCTWTMWFCRKEKLFKCNIITISERALEVRNELYLCFIDYTKAPDCVKHQELVKLIELKIWWKRRKIVRNLYWQQCAAVRWEIELSEYIPIQRGIRQGCALSPDLFAICSEFMMRNIKIRGHIINNIRYADYILQIASTWRKLELFPLPRAVWLLHVKLALVNLVISM